MRTKLTFAQSTRPFFEWALAFILGITLAHHFPVPLQWLFGVLCIAVMGWISSRQRSSSTVNASSTRLILILIAISAGALRTEWQNQSWEHQKHQVDDLSFRGEIILRGTIDDQSPYGETRTALLLSNAEHEQWQRAQRIPGRVQLITSATHVVIGSRIETTATLSPIRGDAVPGGLAFQTWNYARDVFSRAWSDEPLSVIESPQWTPLRGWSHLASGWINQQLTSLDPESSENLHGLIAAMALGIRGHSPEETQRALQQSGLAHLTSISGLHVTLILSGLGWVLCRVLPLRFARILLLIVSLLFLLMVGVRVPTVRAVLMAWVMVGGQLLRRPVVPLNTLGLAALVLLFLSPMELFLPSFQLSFVAVLAIFLFPVPKAFSVSNPIAKSVIDGCWMSFVILMLMAPFSLTYFHQVPFASIPGNLLAVPLVGVTLLTTYIWLLVSSIQIPILVDAVGWAMWALSSCLHTVIVFWGSIDWLCWEPSLPGSASLAIAWLGMLVLHQSVTPLLSLKWIRLRVAHAGLLLIAVAVWLPSFATEPGRLRIDFIALGQGDCILIRTPSGHTLLKDAGPPARDTDTRLVDYLKSEGITRIDALLLSHPQADHIGAMHQVVEAFPVGRFLEGSSSADSSLYETLKQKLSWRGVPTARVYKDDEITLGEVSLRVLHPTPSFRYDDVNEASLVIWLRYRDFDALLTGDIGARTERNLCRALDDWDMDVLKVPHHGSRYSTTAALLDETRPEFAIIQSGRNPYGHPHPDTRQRLYDVQAHVLRTDYLGTVQIHTDGDDYWMYTTRSNTFYRRQLN